VKTVLTWFGSGGLNDAFLFLIVSARGEPIDRIIGLEVGADDYLVKPLEPRELQLRLRNALSRSAHAPGMQAGPHRWAVGKGLFEAARRAIQLGDREVPLTTAEFRLIDLLVRHPNQGATRALTRTDSPVPRFEGRVLLVEDDPLSRELLSMLLVRTGLVVDTACDGADAVRRAGNLDYHLILMDMQLPKLSGPEAAAAIIANRGDTPPAPIIAPTANAFEHDRQRCMDAGMCDFISKPISPNLLFARISRWLASSSLRV